MTIPPPEPVSITEISDLLAWCRRLTDAATSADPDERAAYLAAKADLLARIADERALTWDCEHAAQARQIADDARHIAEQPAHLPSHPTPQETTP
jgi:hypothetical protein